MTQLEPFLIEPQFVERIWGYRDLRPWFDKVANEQPIGEVWLTGDACIVASGPHKGETLAALFALDAATMLGADAASNDSPLLIKVLFAREKLSVQVHPDDELAQEFGEPRGKTECWYALAAQQGAEVALGLKPGATLAAIEQGARNGTLEESLEMVPIATGDMVYVDAGTVHAIWPGSVLLETQQNSDLTYRLYDYGRGRELHVEKSLQAVKFSTAAGKVAPKPLADRTVLLDAQYFRIERIEVSGRKTSADLRGLDGAGLAYLFAAAGSARISGDGFGDVNLVARGIIAIPATAPEFVVEDADGLELIRIVPNRPAKR
jgi:mannose-6-phosphate isomerase